MQLPTASDSRNFLWKLSEGKKPIPPPGLIAAYRSQLANKEYTVRRLLHFHHKDTSCEGLPEAGLESPVVFVRYVADHFLPAVLEPVLPCFQEFLREVPNIAGTWDDHDMGEDNADKMYTFKYGRQLLRSWPPLLVRVDSVGSQSAL